MDVNEQYKKLEELDELELKKLSLLVVTKPGAKYENKNWNEKSKYAAYFIKEFCNNGQIVDTTTKELMNHFNNGKTNINATIKRLVDGGFVCRFPKVTFTVSKSGAITKCRVSKYQYTLIPTNALLDLVEESGFTVVPNREDIDEFRRRAQDDMEKVIVFKSKNNGVNVTTTVTTDSNGNRFKKTEVDTQEVNDRIEEIDEEKSKLQDMIKNNGVEVEIEPTTPLINNITCNNKTDEEKAEDIIELIKNGTINKTNIGEFREEAKLLDSLRGNGSFATYINRQKRQKSTARRNVMRRSFTPTYEDSIYSDIETD